MISLSTSIVLILFGIVFFVHSCWSHLTWSRRPKSPPGPPQLPLIGNLLDMPKDSEWVKYRDLCREYESDIIELNVMGTPIIILNSLKAAVDLLDKRSSIYSGRMRLPMLNDLIGWEWGVAFRPSDDLWRAQRRLFHQDFSPSATRRYHYQQQIQGVHELLRRLLESPENWSRHLRHQAGSTILDIAYGIQILSENDPFITVAEEAVVSVATAGIPGAFLVDTFPFLKYVPSWVPGAGFQKKATKWRRISEEVREAPFQALKKAIADGVGRPSFGLRCLQDIDPNGDTTVQESLIKITAGSMYAAGADSTMSALGTFILAMLMHPQIQAKAQNELDSVVGEGHLPSFDDENSLPYISAIVKECLRWQVVSALAIPHTLTADDEYKGYHLPQGAVIVPNIWAICNDQEAYPDPSVFKPERFLKDGKFDPSVQDPELALFGFGRRVCPGRYMARNTLWITAASILATFDIKKATGKDGEVIEPSGQYSSGLLRYPTPFQCTIVPRSKETENLIRAIIY